MTEAEAALKELELGKEWVPGCVGIALTGLKFEKIVVDVHFGPGSNLIRQHAVHWIKKVLPLHLYPGNEEVTNISKL